MSDTTTKSPKTDSIFKTIAKKTPPPAGPAPAPVVVKEAPQPAVAAPVAAVGQESPGPTAQPTPQTISQAPMQTPVQEPTPVIETPEEPKEIVVDDPEAVIVINGERVKVKDAAHYGFSRAKLLQEEQRIAKSRKEVESLVGNFNNELSDPVIKDYRYLRQAHPDWTAEEVRDAALRANGRDAVSAQTPSAPVPAVAEALPEPPLGAVPGDKDWNDWIAKVAKAGADQAVAPLLAAEQSRQQAEVRKQQSDRVAIENVDLINNKTQQFTHVDLGELEKNEKDAFYDKVGEVLAKRGYKIDGNNRWNTPTGTIDENIYAFAVEAAWPEGSSPKKAQPPAPVIPAQPSPAQIVSDHMNNGLGLVPDRLPTPTPAPPSAAMPVRAPLQNPRSRKSDNPLRALMQTGKTGREG